MWLRLKIALRNAFRNKRRSALNVCMIGGAVSVIIIFEGFTNNMVTGLRETTVETQTGHLQLALNSYWNKTAKKPKENLIPHYKNLLKEISREDGVKYAVGRLEFFSLISLGDKSVSCRALSLDPEKEVTRNRYFNFVSGKALSPKKPFQAALGSGLATKLGAKPRDHISILSHTYDGVVNAMDLEVSGIFQTDISEFDDSTLLMPLKTVQQLLDTTNVEQIVVGLKETSLTVAMKEKLVKKLSPTIPDLQIRTWYSLATMYKQVSMFNRVQSLIVECILMTLVLLSILNTVGMSIFERTGEIGTIRALGEKRNVVILQFVAEGFFLGVGGVLVGLLWGFVSAKFFNSLHIPIMLPGASSPIFVEIDIVLRAMRNAAILGVTTTVLAALIPAYRASRMNIVDALRHNI